MTATPSAGQRPGRTVEHGPDHASGRASDQASDEASEHAAEERAAPRRALSPLHVLLVVAVVGALITVSASWAALSLNHRNEHRLLEVQTRQAGAVIASSILRISDPLTTVLQVEQATGGSTQQFIQATSAIVGPGRLFGSMTLWDASGSGPQLVATAGEPPGMSAGSGQARAFIDLALGSRTFVVSSVGSGAVQRIAYAVAAGGSPRYVVYAERAIPVNRQVPVESNSAFSDLHFATYLGTVARASALATTDLPADQLPLSGDTATDLIPFGNTDVLLVASPRRQLGGTLGSQLPWMFLVGGVLMTTVAALGAYHLVGRRRRAELDARTIAHLYDELGALYGDQRTIAVALQQALLPAYNPAIPGLEIASRYVAGAQGVDIGGDWFSLVALDADHFGFVVGDVSGRGVSAASLMARLRFTIRAYLLEGHPPERVLDMCSRQIDLDVDGHFATVIVGIGDLRTREVVLANAGHLNPLQVSGSESEFLVTKLGLPVGITDATYSPTVAVMAPGSTLLAFTDGLVERRGESIDDGMERLRQAARTPAPTLEEMLSRLVTELTGNESEDDIALLAFRWR